MKTIINYLFATTLLLLALPVSAEEIRNFDQEVVVRPDASLEITETINYDFGDLEKHGIYRDIPYKYKARGGNYELRMKVISVTDDQGASYPYEVMNQGRMKRIKIGDPDVTITGNKIYNIKYEIKRAINFFDEHDEIYWNVTGNAWQVPIRQSKSTVVLPQVVPESEMRSECFAGNLGGDGSCVSERYVYEGAGQVKEIVFIDDVLQPGSGFTIVVGLPKGVLVEPGFFEKMWDVVRDNIIVLVPILLFFFLYNRWKKHGRDTGGRGVVIAQFDAPNKLSPMGVGTLIDERADNKDFSANIINLAIKGYLRIVKLKTGLIFKTDDYALVKMPGIEDLRNSECMILDAIFKSKNLETSQDRLREIGETAGGEVNEVVMMSDLKNVFYNDLKKIKDAIYEELYQEGYFVKNPSTVRGVYMVIGVLTLIFGIPLGMFVFGVIGLISFVLSAIMIMIFGYFMPKKTEKGALATEHIEGLKMYLEVAEKDRLDFHNAPEKNPRTFEKFLPYAMVLGVENKWAKQFEGIYNEEPDWYRGGNVHAFTAAALASDMGSFRTNAVQAASSTPSSASSGGSGFSGGGVGGGFGGGGGGSW